ncbi:MAG: UDP-N-acetylmuramoyl-tripeptide--D-alanyl-D-alanine ligase [Clostridiales bacterium]|nr:UDP-N-acetylmuramoyl-tripeptide--D-alanyl-D-alanine ligase [Clostridiales bacterium]
MMFTLEEIKREIGGKAVYKTKETVFAAFVNVTGVSTDTRTIKEGNIFFALRGERFNGNEYSQTAVDNGACAVVVDNAEYVPDGAIGIVVSDTTDALEKLAAYYRFKLGAKVIAVTGSVGKTTTRTIIADVLRTGFRVHLPEANNNNEIGMSKTILSAPEDTQIVVVEMGMRGLGEIKTLTDIAKPDIAVITNVGSSHIGRLGSRENVLKAKMEIVDGLTDGGILIVNGDDPRLFEHARKILPINNLIAAATTGEKPVDLCPECINSYDVKQTDEGTEFNVRITRLGQAIDLGGPFSIRMFGAAGIRNVLFALLCAHICGLAGTEESLSRIKEVITSGEALDGRGAVTLTKKYMIVNDAYNASPESMENAFLNFQMRSKGRRKVLALGGMLELGDFAAELHEQTGRECAKYGFDKVFVTGENADDFIRGVQSVNADMDVTRCRDGKEVASSLSEYLQVGDAVLFKASHSFEFEKLAEEFIKKGDE